eukprot:s53_g28.t1
MIRHKHILEEYKNLMEWAKRIAERPAVKRGNMVNRPFGEKSEQLHERHARSDFETKTQDGGVQDPTPVRIMWVPDLNFKDTSPTETFSISRLEPAVGTRSRAACGALPRLRTMAGKSLAERRAGAFQTLQVAKAGPVDVAGTRTIRILPPGRSIKDEYDFLQCLHEAGGGQTQVWKASCKSSGEDLIVKVRSRRFAPNGELVWQSLLTRMLNLEGHQNVLGLRDVIQDEGSYYIVMVRCSGGELFDFLQTETDVPERECKRIMREILEAVDHIHSRGLIHRDIKPENIMFHDTSNEPASPKTPASKKAVKLIDFDTCQEYEPKSPRARHIVGTLGYLAPEALQGDYSPASDLWSVGVILYILMTGDMPFEQEIFADRVSDTRCGSESMNSLYHKLKNASVDFECEPWPSFPQARDLCQQLLAFQPEDRSPSARAALNHPWLKGK